MIELSFSCYCSDFKVNPRNWQSSKCPVKKDWFIYYRFYDPEFKTHPKFSKGKLVVIKGMNHFKDLSDRQVKTRGLLQQELEKLKFQAYNPITGKSLKDVSTAGEINPETPWMEALANAEKRITASSSTKRDLKSILRQVSLAARQLRLADLPVKSISRKHIKQVLAQIENNLGESAHRYNKIRSYLMILYKELLELEAVEINPIRDLSKKKSILRIRKLPSMESRAVINTFLLEKHPRFWLFMQIFFHSGARITELIKVQRKHVDLEKQIFIATVRKGAFKKEVVKPIKNVALEFWREAVSTAGWEDFIFSRDLKPGAVPIQSYQITKRWNRHVKKKLELTDDFYSLKHLNLDETAAVLGIDAAAAMASHTSTAVTIKHYAVNEVTRQNEKLRQVNNKFA